MERREAIQLAAITPFMGTGNMGPTFVQELTQILNKHAMGARSKDNDRVLAYFLLEVLDAFENASIARDEIARNLKLKKAIFRNDGAESD